MQIEEQREECAEATIAVTVRTTCTSAAAASAAGMLDHVRSAIVCPRSRGQLFYLMLSVTGS
jgi:hypothetical protein